jgi:hypothetical protein
MDDDCDGVTDNEASVCARCTQGLCPLTDVRDGSTTVGVDLKFQYSPVTTGEGYIKANWEAAPGATGYLLSIGSTPGGDDILAETPVGNVTSNTATGLTVEGAWTGTMYYVTVKPTTGNAVGAGTTSNGVGIAELETWDGTPNGLARGVTVDWPAAGLAAYYGAHYFETVSIPAESTVQVQGFGKADSVGEGVAATDEAVVNPKDGWLALYANSITVEGTIAASGRGFGGGGGGGGGSGSVGRRGHGGIGGLGGRGGDGEGTATGGGGGGSPLGVGGLGGQGNGGSGSLLGGGSGSSACGGKAGRSTADGIISDIGMAGTTASSGVVGVGGPGEFANGGAHGVPGCDNWTGAGGGGYGAGGGGASQWNSSGVDAGGGGGGGTGGVGGGESAHGGAGAGLFGGAGGLANFNSSRVGQPGAHGGYRALGGNGDTSTDRTLWLGGGGGGGGAGYQESGGGGGAAGGGFLVLYAAGALSIGADARLLANGAGAGGGARDNGGNCTGAAGGNGAGGGILLEAKDVSVLGAMSTRISARGGGGSTANGGTIKLFYGTYTGEMPDGSNAGRIYDAQPGSFEQ